MQPFDSAGAGPWVGAGASGLQQAYDARRLHYLECIIRRAYLHSDRFSQWIEDDHRLHPVPKEGSTTGETGSPYSMRHTNTCDAISELGLDALDPGLDIVLRELDEMDDDARNALQKKWLLGDARETALARALLVRADPTRQDEVFGWERAGVGLDEYWARLVPSAHMTYLLETADFGANEMHPSRLPARRDPRAPGHGGAALARRARPRPRPELPRGRCRRGPRLLPRLQVLVGRPVPLRRVRWRGAEESRSKAALNGHEDMSAGQDMTYWSENHRLLFATAEYLAGQFWPDEQFVSQAANRKGGRGAALRPGDLTGAPAHGQGQASGAALARRTPAPGILRMERARLLRRGRAAARSTSSTSPSTARSARGGHGARPARPSTSRSTDRRRVRRLGRPRLLREQELRVGAVDPRLGRDPVRAVGHFTGTSNARGLPRHLAVIPAARRVSLIARSAPPRFTSRAGSRSPSTRRGDHGVGFTHRRRHGVLVEPGGLRDQADDRRIAGGRDADTGCSTPRRSRRSFR